VDDVEAAVRAAPDFLGNASSQCKRSAILEEYSETFG